MVQENQQLLTVTDLLDISVDVIKGCAYLERLHFVHRSGHAHINSLKPNIVHTVIMRT